MNADDTVLYSSNPAPKLMLNKLQNSFNIITSWCDMNLLTINESKTKYCLFNNNHLDLQVLKCKGQSLGLVQSYKYLGVDIASD